MTNCKKTFFLCLLGAHLILLLIWFQADNIPWRFTAWNFALISPQTPQAINLFAIQTSSDTSEVTDVMVTRSPIQTSRVTTVPTVQSPRKTSHVPSATEATVSEFPKPSILWWHPSGYVNVAVERLKSICPQCARSMTFDMALLPEVPVVIFDGHLPNMPRTPPQRPRGQVWVFYAQEAPHALAGSVLQSPVWRSAFNWTATFRRDSDLWTPYGMVRPLASQDGPVDPRDRTKDWDLIKRSWRDPRGQRVNLTSVMAGKQRGVAAWMVSACKTLSRRDEYVKELQKHFRVDIWGGCGEKKCSRLSHDECERRISQQYKFYLSFENNLCEDYVSEKFFTRLRNDIIPVVRGGANYSFFGPPGSYIDVKDFAGPKELADFLHALDKDDERYENMLRQKRHFTVEIETYTYGRGINRYTHSHYLAKPLCHLCKMVSEREKRKRQYDNIYEWFTSGKCWAPKDVK